MRDSRNEHPALIAQRHLAEVATMFPDLIYGLGRNGNGQGQRVTGSKERPLPIRENVSEALGEVHEFAMYLADRVYWEAGENLSELMDDDILATVSRRLIGVFAPNDDAIGRDFAKECRRLAARVRAVAYPHGARWIDVPNRADDKAERREPMPCVEMVSDASGEQVPCPGHYRMRISPDGAWFMNVADPASWPPLTCKADERHVVTGVELAKALAWARMNETTCGEELRAWRTAA